jgi:hypothetical protein
MRDGDEEARATYLEEGRGGSLAVDLGFGRHGGGEVGDVM